MGMQSSSIDDIMRVPWQTSVVCAIGLFIFVQFLSAIQWPPAIDGSTLQAMQSVGLVFSFLILLGSMMSFVGEKIRNRRYRKSYRRSGFRTHK
jgi:hypothetical protein